MFYIFAVNTKVCTRYLLRYFLPHSDHNARTVVGGLGHFFTMTHYELSKSFFDFSFENPEKINPAHSAIFFFAIEHCNRLGWKEKFGFPTSMAMDAIGIRNHHTYIRYFNDLVHWGFFILIEKSKNQYSSNIISLASAMSKNNKALDKARTKHLSKQVQSTYKSKCSISKQVNNITINNITGKTIFSNSEIADLFDTFLSIQDRPKSEIQIEALVKRIKSFPDDKTRIEALENSIRAGYPDVYLPRMESKTKNNEIPEPIFMEGKQCVAVKSGSYWVYPDIYAVEINREANTALLSDGSIQPLTEQQKSFNEAEFQFIKKVVYP